MARTRQQPPPPPPEGHGAEAAAALAAGGATIASLGPAGAGLKAEAEAAGLSSAAAGTVLAALLKGLNSYSVARQEVLIPELTATLRAHYPEQPADQLEQLARAELGREREFRKKMADRLRADIAAALKLPTPEERREALKAILERERRYVRMREEAMHERVIGAAEQDAVKRASPQGAYWWLSPHVQQHTPDCVALGHRFWPWPVIEAVGGPPRHPGCACELLTLAEAVERDYMDAGQVPDPKDALALAKKLLKAAGEVIEHVEPEHFVDHLRSLQEGAAIEGAMVALYPSKQVARKLAGQREADEEPAHIHMTLVFLGPDAEQLEPSRKAIRKAVARAAAQGKPLKGVVGGIGVFSGDPKADERPLVALADVVGLNELRSQIVRELGKNIGPNNHGFTPHITLRYMPKDEVPPRAKPPAQLPLEFDEVVLVWGGERESFKLGEKSELAEQVGTIEDELGSAWQVHGGPLEECWWEAETRTVFVCTGAASTDRAELVEALGSVPGVRAVEFEPLELEEAAGRRMHAARRGHYGAHAGERYAKGLEKGGEFKPQRGSSRLAARKGLRLIGRVASKLKPSAQDRKLMRDLAPELPRPPAERRDVRREVKIEGRTVKIPEQRAFKREINGREYTSPPGSTNVYRDGEPFDGDQKGGAPRGEVKVAPGTGARQTAVELRVEAERAERQDDHTTRIMAALAQRDPDFSPVSVDAPGEGTDRALLEAGFLETGLSRGRDQTMIEYAAPDGSSTLRVAYDMDTGKVAGSDWEPRRPREPGRLMTREPRTLDEFSADLDALARTIARRHGKHAHLGEIGYAAQGDPDYSDHAGEHHWNGDVTLGEDFGPSILRAASARARGADRTPQQRRMLYASVQSGIHEMLHAAFPTGKEHYERQEQLNLNEALVEELSHLEAARTLARWGSTDVLRWRADNPQDPKALGTYTPERAALGRTLDAAGIPPELREPYLLRLASEVAPDDRFAELGQRLPGGEAEARRLMLRARYDTGFTPLLLPDLEPTIGGPEPFQIGGVPIDRGDRVMVRRRILQDGDMVGQDQRGTVTLLRGGDGADWTAEVSFDDGSVDHGVLPSMLSDVDKAGADKSIRVWGAEAGQLDHGGERYRPGDTIRYGRTDGKTSEAVVVRVLRARDPEQAGPGGWALEAVTTRDSAREGSRVVLTPANTEGRLELVREGSQASTEDRERTWNARAKAGIPTTEERAALSPYFSFPSGTRVVDRGRLLPTKSDPPEKVDKALSRMQDAAAGRRQKRLPLAVHEAPDGRLLVLDGNSTLQASERMGLERVAVMPDAAQQIDRWILAREAQVRRGGLTDYDRGVIEALREARAIVVRGEGGPEIFREALRRGPLEGGGDFNEGLQTGFRSAFLHLRDSAQALGLEKLGARNFGGFNLGWGKHHDGDENDEDDEDMPKWFIEKQASWEGGDKLQDDEPAAPWTEAPDWLKAKQPKAQKYEPAPPPKPQPFKSKKPGGPALEPLEARDWKAIPDVDVGDPLGPTREEALATYLGTSSPPKPYLKRLPRGVEGPPVLVQPAAPSPNISAGVVMVEDDGRVWAMEPRNHFGDYMAILPKGRVDPGETEQQAALRELFEETGMHGEITGLVGDYAGSTGITRYFLARRTGGKPEGSPESYRVMLEPPEKIPFRMRDRVALGHALGLGGPAPAGKGKKLDVLKLYGYDGTAVDPEGSQWKIGTVRGWDDAVESVELTALDTNERQTLDGEKETWKGWTFFPKPAHGGGAKQQANAPGAKDDSGTVTLTKPAGGSNGAYFAEDADGVKWIVKSYKGNVDRVATELLANSVYRKLEIAVPEAGSLEFDGTPALAYPIVEGQPGGYGLPIKGSKTLADGFMADALLANWDVVGLEYDNVLWPEGTTEVTPDTPGTRLDQGGTFQYRAQGANKPFGPVPAEVWSMATGQGQANGRFAMTEESNKAQAAKIEAVLTPQVVDALVDAAPFENKTMQQEVREALKARVAWMGAYSRGEVDEHGPVEGAAAKAALEQAKPAAVPPEQEVAAKAWVDGWDEAINDKLRAGSPLTPAERMVAEHLDELVRSSKVPEETFAYFALPPAEVPEAGWESKRVTDAGFLGLALDPAEPAGGQLVRVRLRAGSSALLTDGSPEIVLGRGTTIRLSGETDGVIEGTYIGRDWLASKDEGGGAANEPLEPLERPERGAQGLRRGLEGGSRIAGTGARSPGVDDDYRGQHSAPEPEEGTSMDAPTSIYPEDVYGANGAHFYGDGGDAVSLDRASLSILQRVRGNPEARVPVYRAVPDSLDPEAQIARLEREIATYLSRGSWPESADLRGRDGSDQYEWASAELDRLRQLEPAQLAINPGDWVTPNRAYARRHGEATLLGRYRILKADARAGDLYTDGNSLHEWGWWPSGGDDGTTRKVYPPDAQKGDDIRGARNQPKSVWSSEPLTDEQMLAMVRAGLELTPDMMLAGQEGGLTGMLYAGAVIRPDMTAALQDAGYKLEASTGARSPGVPSGEESVAVDVPSDVLGAVLDMMADERDPFGEEPGELEDQLQDIWKRKGGQPTIRMRLRREALNTMIGYIEQAGDQRAQNEAGEDDDRYMELRDQGYPGAEVLYRARHELNQGGARNEPADEELPVPEDTPQQKATLRSSATARKVRAKFPTGTRVVVTPGAGAEPREGAEHGVVLRHVPGTNAQGGSLTVSWDSGHEGRISPGSVQLEPEIDEPAASEPSGQATSGTSGPSRRG